MPQKHKIVVTNFVTEPLQVERDVLADVADVTALDGMHEKDLWPRIDDAEAVMLYHGLNLTPATIDRLTRCKLIVRCGVGYDNVDHVYARKRSIPVANVPDYGTEEVADSAIGMTLALTRGIHLLNSRLRRKEGPWLYTQTTPLQRLRGKVFGIIGLGRIGSAAALRAKALNMRVVFYDPFLPDGYDKALGVERVETLDELLAQVYVLSVHSPATPVTIGMIGREAIRKMPRGSYVVNTARGPIVDTTAVVEALAEGHLAGAGIDVLVTEPPRGDEPVIVAWRDPNHPAHDRLILNPHAAFYCEQGLEDMRRKGAIACRNAMLGKMVRNIVN